MMDLHDRMLKAYNNVAEYILFNGVIKNEFATRIGVTYDTFKAWRKSITSANVECFYRMIAYAKEIGVGVEYITIQDLFPTLSLKKVVTDFQHWRLVHNYTLRDVAHKIGIHDEDLSNWIAGKSSLSTDQENAIKAIMKNINMLDIVDINNLDGIDYIKADLMLADKLRSYLLKNPLHIHEDLSYLIGISQSTLSSWLRTNNFKTDASRKKALIFLYSRGEITVLDLAEMYGRHYSKYACMIGVKRGTSKIEVGENPVLFVKKNTKTKKVK